MTSLALKKFRDRSASFTARRQRSSSLDCVLNVPTRARRSSCFIHGLTQVCNKMRGKVMFLVKVSARHVFWTVARDSEKYMYATDCDGKISHCRAIF